MRRLNCEKVIQLLTEYMEGGLPGDLSRQVEAHLRCDACRSFLETLVKTRNAVRDLREEQIPAGCRGRLMRLIEEHIPDPRSEPGS